MNGILDIIEAHRSLFAAYVAVGCLIAIISLLSSWRTPQQISAPLFLIGHAFWPITLMLIVIAAYRAPQD